VVQHAAHPAADLADVDRDLYLWRLRALQRGRSAGCGARGPARAGGRGGDRRRGRDLYRGADVLDERALLGGDSRRWRRLRQRCT
jgi:hypothetical protein